MYILQKRKTLTWFSSHNMWIIIANCIYFYIGFFCLKFRNVLQAQDRVGWWVEQFKCEPVKAIARCCQHLCINLRDTIARCYQHLCINLRDTMKGNSGCRCSPIYLRFIQVKRGVTWTLLLSLILSLFFSIILQTPILDQIYCQIDLSCLHSCFYSTTFPSQMVYW